PLHTHPRSRGAAPPCPFLPHPPPPPRHPPPLPPRRSSDLASTTSRGLRPGLMDVPVLARASRSKVICRPLAIRASSANGSRPPSVTGPLTLTVIEKFDDLPASSAPMASSPP